MRSLSSVGLLLVACSYDAQIIGDSPEHLRVVEEVLDEFTAASSLDLKLSRIQVREMTSASGRYNSVSRGIRLQPVDDLNVFRKNTRHELCHAFDLQGDFNSADDPFWTMANERIRASYSTRVGRREAFAGVCQAGVEALGLVGGCTPEAAVVQQMSAELFDQAEPPAELVIEWSSRYDLLPGHTLATASGTVDGLVGFRTHGPDSRSYYFVVDPSDGLPKEREQSGLNTLEVGDLPPVEPWWAEFERQLPSGEIVARTTWTLVTGDVLSNAVLLTNQGQLQSRCVEGNSSFFWTDGAPWLVEQVGEELRFGRVIR